MFRKMRRKDKQLPEKEAIDILNSEEEGILATIGKDGYPYAVPLNYAYNENSIFFHCALSGLKIDNMDYNSKVSFCVIRDTRVIPEDFSTKFQSVVLFGTAQEVFDGEKKEGLRLLIKKLSGDHIAAGEKYIKNAWDKTRVFRIDIDHITGKAGK